MNAVLTFQPEPAILTQLVRLASQEKQSEEEIIGQAVKQHLDRHRPVTPQPFTVAEILDIGRECAALPEIDTRTPEEILGYDKSPMGLWENSYGA